MLTVVYTRCFPLAVFDQGLSFEMGSPRFWTELSCD